MILAVVETRVLVRLLPLVFVVPMQKEHGRLGRTSVPKEFPNNCFKTMLEAVVMIVTAALMVWRGGKKIRRRRPKKKR
jgi:hypothetical protein